LGHISKLTGVKMALTDNEDYELLKDEFLELVFDERIKIDKKKLTKELTEKFVNEYLNLYSHSISMANNMSHALQQIIPYFPNRKVVENDGSKENIKNAIKSYSEKNPKQILLYIKHFLKKLTSKLDDEILNDYPTINEYIQNGFKLNDEQQVKMEEYLKYEDFKFPDSFYKDLIDEINKCYGIGAYSAVRILTRKLLENLLIDIFKTAKLEKEKYYDGSRNEFRAFSKLIKLLELELSQNSKKLHGYLFNNEITDLIEYLENFRKKGNSNAHSIIVKTRKEDIEEEKEDLIHVIRILIERIYLNL
jgi:hypothetical protein